MGRRTRTPVGLGLIAIVAVLLATACGTANRHGARTILLEIHSRYIGTTLPAELVIPAGAPARGRGMVVFLHGRGADEHSYLVKQMFAALARLGTRAPYVLFPYGDDHSYWHDRADGRWTEYVVDEVIPKALALVHADPRRVAIGGISMGGFGAYDIARLNPGRFCAVGGHSPALWQSGSETASGAFDDAADFARNDVIGVARTGRPYGHTPLWIDAGDKDPFLPGDRAMVAALRAHGERVSFHVWPGGHDSDYWDSHWGEYLRFYASALAGCG